MENKFFRFLAHAGIVFAMFLIFGMWGSEIDFADPSVSGGYHSTNGMMVPILFVFPFFIILQLVFDVMSEWENVILSFIRGVLAFVGVVGIVLGSIISQGVLSMDFDGTLPTVFQAALVSCGAFSGFVALYLYVGAMMDDRQEKSFLIPPLSIAISFVINLVFALLGHYVSPFFYSWMLFIIMAVGTVVVVVCIFKFGMDSVVDHAYPSGFSGGYKSPAKKPAGNGSSGGGRQSVKASLIEAMEDLSSHPDDHIKHDDYLLRIDSPMPYELDMDKKEIFFNADMYMNTYDEDELYASRLELQDIIESLVKESLSKAAAYDSYFNPEEWDVFASVMLYNADQF